MRVMTSSIFVAAIVVVLLAYGPLTAFAQFHKCMRHGAVTYQNMPCPPTEPATHPTVEQLNAERQRKLAQARESAASSNAVTKEVRAVQKHTTEGGRPVASQAGRGSEKSSRWADAEARFSCDGRQYCAQMKSCAEAHYFLSHCPGVKMDGDKDGIPCEEQWCDR